MSYENKIMYVEYHSTAWMILHSNWMTAEIVELNGVRIAKMIWVDSW